MSDRPVPLPPALLPPAPLPPAPLAPTTLYRACDPAGLGFATTDELTPLETMLGQERAVGAVEFGLGIRRDGYNLFALGPPGTGKRTVVEYFTRRQAAAEPTPSDWVYVFNFSEAHKPRALELPPGRGAGLRQDMLSLIEELKAALPAAFESDDYRTRRQIILDQFREMQEQAFGEVEALAKERHVAIIRTPMGMALAPLRDGEVLKPEEFHRLSKAEQERLQEEMNAIQEKLQAVFHNIPQWESERRERMRELNREVTRFAISHLIEGLRQRYADLANVLDHLKVVQDDLVENAEQFLAHEQSGSDNPLEQVQRHLTETGLFFDRYRVNPIVERTSDGGAPVIEEGHPTLPNLIGRVEYRQQLGALVTDFTLIKGGALHRANGGYLILDARRVLLQPYAWEELKRTLRARAIEIRSLSEVVGFFSTVALEPEPIPLEVKVVLLGDRILYYLLSALDPDFRELFKVAADFDDAASRSAESERAYARLIATIAKRDDLKPLDAAAVARAIEHAVRLAGDNERLTADLEAIADLLREADYLTTKGGGTVTTAAEVARAIEGQITRASRLRERLQEEIHRGTILIDTAGAQVGQVNGLSVLELGGFAFGRPSRITATVRLGRGEVIDIERQVRLGGPLHSKGVLILAGFLGNRFGRERPLSLSASLVFEQSYGGVDGDSASMAELCTLLSALAETPIRQGIAITGSVNQHGAAQAIGGVNEKIEGYFDVCRAAGLDGRQGVVIPAANAKHLMLRADVVAAAAAGRFQVWPVTTVDEALSILTGITAGERDAAGRYPVDSVNGRVDAALQAMAEKARAFGGGKDRTHEGGS